MHPPRLARWLVTAFVRGPEREFLLGDLEEQFRITMAASGRLAASRQYWGQAIVSAWHARRVGRSAARPRRRIDMSMLWQELRLAVRTAWKAPLYSLIAIGTLAFAIGANTLLFSIASPLAIRPLPIKDPGTLGWIWRSNQPSGVDRNPSSIAELLDFRASAKSFASIGGIETATGTLTGDGDAQLLTLARVTSEFGDMWGLQPVAGRLFQRGEDAVGRPLAGVLSHRYWQKRFAGDRSVIGRTFLLDGRALTVVGVMEPKIELGSLANYDLWVPLPLDATLPRDQRTVKLIGRLAPGATIASADAEIHGLATRLAAEHPDTSLNWDAHVVSTKTAIVGTNTWAILILLSVVVTFVLLIACANLANLVLARVIARRHDFAVRLALGASRLQVVRPLLLENLIFGFVGGAAGLAIAQAGLRLVNVTANQTDPYLKQVGIDGYVLTFTFVLSVVTPIIFSLGPAIGAGRVATIEALRAARSSSGGPRARWQRNLLVGSQIALALSLLVVSALVIQTSRNMQQLRIGLDIRHVLTFHVTLPPGQYRSAAGRDFFVHESLGRLTALPGVGAAAVTSHLPVFDDETVRSLSGTLHDGTSDDVRPWASSFAISPGFFQAAAIPVLAGRAFTTSDLADAPAVAILGQTAAEKYFDDVANSIGRTVAIRGRGQPDRLATIVGVVADTKNSTGTKTSPQLWVPFDQAPNETMTFVIRSDDPGARARDVQGVMRAVNPDVAISEPTTMTKLARDVLASSTILSGLFLGFAVLALILAAAGLYGVVSYTVGQRHREIGVRLALGAAPVTIRRMVLTDGLKITMAGMAVGLALAVLLAHGAASFLYGVTPNDPATFASVAVVLFVVAIAAVWNPASRAMRVDPVKTLRAD